MYAIKDWNKVFEDYRSREVEELEFVKLPVRRESEVAQKLRKTADGLIAFAVFIMLVQWAARNPTRGVLRDARGPITPERFADRYGTPIKIVRKAFETLAAPECGWLEITDDAPTQHRPSIEPMQPAPSPTPSPAAATNTPPTTTTDGAAAAADSLREWAAEQAKRPEWLPAGKPWISTQAWLATAQACPHVTRGEFEAIIREARQSRSTLTNPAGFVLAKLKALGGVA